MYITEHDLADRDQEIRRLVAAFNRQFEDLHGLMAQAREAHDAALKTAGDLYTKAFKVLHALYLCDRADSETDQDLQRADAEYLAQQAELMECFEMFQRFKDQQISDIGGLLAALLQIEIKSLPASDEQINLALKELS